MGEGASTNSGCNDEEFDEFGFKVDVEDGPEQSSSKLLSTPFQDNPQQRYQFHEKKLVHSSLEMTRY